MEYQTTINIVERARNLPERKEKKIVKIELKFFVVVNVRCHELVIERKTFLA